MQYVSYEAQRHTLTIELNAVASLVLNLKHLLKVKLALSFQQ